MIRADLGGVLSPWKSKKSFRLWWKKDMRAIMLFCSLFLISVFYISYKDDCNIHGYFQQNKLHKHRLRYWYIYEIELYRNIALLFKTKWAISAFLRIVVLLQKFAHKNGFKFISQKCGQKASARCTGVPQKIHHIKNFGSY